MKDKLEDRETERENGRYFSDVEVKKEPSGLLNPMNWNDAPRVYVFISQKSGMQVK